MPRTLTLPSISTDDVLDAVTDCAIETRYFIRQAFKKLPAMPSVASPPSVDFIVRDLAPRVVRFAARFLRDRPLNPEAVRAFLVLECGLEPDEEPAAGFSPLQLARRAFGIVLALEQGARAQSPEAVFVEDAVEDAIELVTTACEVCGELHGAATIRRRSDRARTVLARERRLCASCALELGLVVECSCGAELDDDSLDRSFSGPLCRECGDRETRDARRAGHYA